MAEIGDDFRKALDEEDGGIGADFRAAMVPSTTPESESVVVGRPNLASPPSPAEQREINFRNHPGVKPIFDAVEAKERELEQRVIKQFAFDEDEIDRDGAGPVRIDNSRPQNIGGGMARDFISRLRRAVRTEPALQEMRFSGVGPGNAGKTRTRRDREGDNASDPTLDEFRTIGFSRAQEFLQGGDVPTQVLEDFVRSSELESEILDSYRERQVALAVESDRERKGGALTEMLDAVADVAGAPVRGFTFGFVDPNKLGREAGADLLGGREDFDILESGDAINNAEGAAGLMLSVLRTGAEFTGALPVIHGIGRGIARAGVPKAAIPSAALAAYSFLSTPQDPNKSFVENFTDLEARGTAGAHGAALPLFAKWAGSPFRRAFKKASPVIQEVGAEAFGFALGGQAISLFTGNGLSIEHAFEEFLLGAGLGFKAGAVRQAAEIRQRGDAEVAFRRGVERQKLVEQEITDLRKIGRNQRRLGRGPTEAERVAAESRLRLPEGPREPPRIVEAERAAEPRPQEIARVEGVLRASSDINPEALKASNQAVVEGGKIGRPVEGLQAGIPLGRRTAKAVAEGIGKVKQYLIDAPLRVTDRFLVEQATRLPGISHTIRTAKAARETVEARLPSYRLGQEYVSRRAELQRAGDLARHDAKMSLKSLTRADNKKHLSTEQQELATKWLEGEATTAEVDAQIGPRYREKLETFRRQIDANQEILRDLGWMSEGTFQEWVGNWLPRVFSKIEAQSRPGSSPLTGSKKAPKVFRRKSRFDFFNEKGEIVESFKTKEQATAFEESRAFETELSKMEHRDKVRAVQDQIRDIERVPSVERVRGIRKGTGVEVEVGLSNGKNQKRFFEDPVEAEAYQAKQEAIRDRQRGNADTIKQLRGQLAELTANAPRADKLRRVDPISDQRLRELDVIRDPAVLVGHGLATQAMTIEVMRFLDKIAKNKRWVSDQKSDVHFEQIPQNKQYGPMAGKWVHRSMRREIVGMLGERTIWDRIARLSDGMLSSWKLGKTAGRPATHGRNIMGNFLIGELAGFSFMDPANIKHFTEATRILRSKPGEAQYETLRFLIKEGIAGADFISTEVSELARDVARERGATIKDKMNNYWESRFADLKGGRLNQAVPGGGDALRALSVFYRLEDILPKMGDYVRRVRSGTKPKDAAREVRENWPQYDEALTSRLMGARGIGPSGLRSLTPDFLTFTTEAMRLGLKHMGERPATFAAIVMGLREASRQLWRMAGLDDEEVEEMNRVLPEHRRIGASGFVIPGYGSDNEQAVMDLTYVIPLMDEIESISNMFDPDNPLDPASLQSAPVSHRVMLAAQLLANKNFFKNKPIDGSDGRFGFSATSKAQGDRDKLRFLAETLLPNIWPGGRDFRVAKEAIEGVPLTRDGKVKRDGLLTALDLIAGVKIVAFDAERDEANTVRQIESLISKKLNRITEVRRDARIDESEIDELKIDILGLYNHYRRISGEDEILDESQLPPRIRKELRKRIQGALRRQGRNKSLGSLVQAPGSKRKTLRDALSR